MEILSEYKTKLDQCEVLCHRNTLLEDFISTWKKCLSEGKNLSGKQEAKLVSICICQAVELFDV